MDGHYREPCLRAELPKLWRVGWLPVDDSEWWNPPVECWGIPAGWRIDTRARNWTKETTIWQRPE